MPAPSISLAVIARDEERSIQRVLASARPLVDELTVLDTGSVDATVRLAEAAGATVAYADWVNDFAAARNAALAATKGDVVLMLDADEWVVDSDADALRSWCSANVGTGQVIGGAVAIESAMESDGASLLSQDHIVRMIPRGVRFEGKIHEQVVGLDRVVPVEGFRVRHDGYEPVQVARKRGRNEALLRQSLRERPDSPYLWFQLGRELQIDGAFTSVG